MNDVVIDVKLSGNAYMPVRAHEPDAGADLFSPVGIRCIPGNLL